MNLDRETPVPERDVSAKAAPVMDAPSGTEMVLIVDDEPLVLRLCCTILSRQGYDVLGANSADEAIRYCEEDRKEPHLLLSDIIMPKLRGTALAERIIRLRPSIRVLYMSGFDGREIPE